MFERILVSVDEDHAHLEMVDKAARMLGEAGLLELFCCVHQALLGSGGLRSAEAERRARHAYMTQCEARLDHLADRIRLPHERVGTDVSWNAHLVQGVLTKVERFRPDLLVYPVSSHPGFLHHLLAPEDWKLLREATLPLLMTREHHWGSRLRLAVALDPFHPLDEPASLDGKLYGIAHHLARHLDAELHVLHSYQALPQSTIFDEHRVTDFAGLQEEVRHKHQQKLEAMLAPWRNEPGAAQLHLIEGELHHVVPDFVEQTGIDLLIVGNVPRGALDRLLSGSSAERLLDRVRCDLMVIKP
ncbi:universal stress protein [Marinobacterium litorale]|jgi:universal stress protein E|uniref:universal stress protein n=1 Tax=Marinobacterium litorale TaxID=404770 RepID=UPI000424821F|nr:universal stress protein [Marinobacterium litorale]